jgi:hypothetical protein
MFIRTIDECTARYPNISDIPVKECASCMALDCRIKASRLEGELGDDEI